MRVSLVKVFERLTEEQAKACWLALGQWADNERNGIDEGAYDAGADEEKADKNCKLVEGVVEQLNTEIQKLAEV